MNTFELEATEFQQTRIRHWDFLNAAPQRSASEYYRTKIRDTYQYLIPPGSKVLELGCGRGDLLASLSPSAGTGVDFSSPAIVEARVNHPSIEFITADANELQLQDQIFDYIVLSDLVNELWDVQTVLESIQPLCGSHTRIILNFYSHLWNIPLTIAQQLGAASPRLAQNWLTPQDVRNLLEISKFEPLRSWSDVICPVKIPYFSDWCNRYLAKIWPFRLCSIANFVIARPADLLRKVNPSVSVIVAARNESGHIDELISRIPEMGSGTEIIFVEGNSTDDTYAAIERAIACNPSRNCKLLKQPGRGKGDAVRTGFDAATGDILMILDADITVPPEDLPRFYDIMSNGSAEFVNGVRLVYPMEGDAMRFANLIGNKFFSWAFSWLLGQPIRDTLCGTKVLWRQDYRRIADNRAYFGDFDPFGDFDLLFGAAMLNLKIMEVPVRYRARRYGETNISRWSHGWLLLKMVVFAARRIKFI
jgi:ubiquinone/menaquinone biosynthesis C-methylase UbiE